jgi:FkbM family methyltransferase
VATRVLSRGDGERRVVEVLDGALVGMQLELDLAREKAFWGGEHEPEIQQLVDALPLDGARAWDIGAHIGFFALQLARRCDAVLAVEANPQTLARLRRNVELNHAPVVVLQAAVAGAVGTRLLELGVDTGTHRLDGVSGASYVATTGGAIEVEAVTLDSLIDDYGAPSFVKIDIEGAEAEALENAPRLLSLRPTILCELHSAAASERVRHVLEAAGYVLHDVSRDHVLAEPLTNS